MPHCAKKGEASFSFIFATFGCFVIAKQLFFYHSQRLLFFWIFFYWPEEDSIFSCCNYCQFLYLWHNKCRLNDLSLTFKIQILYSKIIPYWKSAWPLFFMKWTFTSHYKFTMDNNCYRWLHWELAGPDVKVRNACILSQHTVRVLSDLFRRSCKQIF